jgi:hypothetical protein
MYIAVNAELPMLHFNVNAKAHELLKSRWERIKLIMNFCTILEINIVQRF